MPRRHKAIGTTAEFQLGRDHYLALIDCHYVEIRLQADPDVGFPAAGQCQLL